MFFFLFYQTDHDGKEIKKDEVNGHAMAGLDLTDAGKHFIVT